MNAPPRMRCLQLDTFGGPESLRVVERAVPEPGPGQVLVRVLASPVNPSDVSFCRGLYGIDRSLPTTPGFEGCGEVVASGGGLFGRLLVGRRVACAAQGDDGLWAEYAVVPAFACLPLPAKISNEQGASALVNPVSAWAMFDRFRRERSPALIQSAAASQLGRMILRLGKKQNATIIHVVRRPELVDLLKKLGGEHVLNSSAPDFDAELKDLAHRLNATWAIDAVGGAMTGQVLNAMPSGTVVVYGALSGESCAIDPRDLIFQKKRVEGFWLSEWMRGQNPLSVLVKLRGVVGMLDGELASNVAVRLTLEEAAAELPRHLESTSKGKTLIVPTAT